MVEYLVSPVSTNCAGTCVRVCVSICTEGIFCLTTFSSLLFCFLLLCGCSFSTYRLISSCPSLLSFVNPLFSYPCWQGSHIQETVGLHPGILSASWRVWLRSPLTSRPRHRIPQEGMCVRGSCRAYSAF